VSHLTPEMLEALLDGSLPADRREGAPPAAPEPAAERAMWGAVERALPAPRRRRGWAGGGLALAAAALLVSLARAPQPPYDGVKGAGAPPGVTLRVVVGRDGPAGFEPGRRLVDGDAAGAGETLLFELECGAPAARYLFAIDGAGALTQLSPPEGAARVEPAGRAPVTWRGQWLALDLSDAASPLTLVAAASSEALDPEREVALPWRRGEPLDQVRYDSLRLGITP